MARARQLSITFAALKLRQTLPTELCAGDPRFRRKPYGSRFEAARGGSGRGSPQLSWSLQKCHFRLSPVVCHLSFRDRRALARHRFCIKVDLSRLPSDVYTCHYFIRLRSVCHRNIRIGSTLCKCSFIGQRKFYVNIPFECPRLYLSTPLPFSLDGYLSWMSRNSSKTPESTERSQNHASCAISRSAMLNTTPALSLGTRDGREVHHHRDAR
jgi:hypothetical protein